jgi:hypothetical protein
MSCSIIQVNLICSDTEAAYHDEVFGFPQYFCSKLGLRPDANDVDVSVFEALAKVWKLLPRKTVPYLLNELIFWQRRLQCLHLISLSGKNILARLIDIL